MLSPAEIADPPNITIVPLHDTFTSVASVPRAVAHLELFRSGVNGYLDAIAAAPDAFTRDGVIAEMRVFVETYSRAPLPAPRAPPAAEERCVAVRNGGKQCTRRRKNGTTFCGTHMRCNQSGNADAAAIATMGMNTETVSQVGTERALRAAVSSSGIPQFVDDTGATWCAEDVCSAHVNPRSV